MEDHPLYSFNLHCTTKYTDATAIRPIWLACLCFWKMAHVVRWCIYEVARVPSTEDYDFKLHHPGIWSELCTGQMSCPVFGLVHNIHLYIFLMTAGGRMCKWDFIANIPPPFEGAQMHYMFLGHTVR